MSRTNRAVDFSDSSEKHRQNSSEQCGRQSCTARWNGTPSARDNVEEMRLVVQFGCFNSCSTIDKRNILLIATLESRCLILLCRQHSQLFYSGYIIGRCCVNLKVCAAPGRDADLLEQKLAGNAKPDRRGGSHKRKGAKVKRVEKREMQAFIFCAGRDRECGDEKASGRRSC